MPYRLLIETGHHVRIVIEAVGGQVRPEGVFRRGDFDPVPFSGWLELLRLLEVTFEGAEAAAALSQGDMADRPSHPPIGSPREGDGGGTERAREVER